MAQSKNNNTSTKNCGAKNNNSDNDVDYKNGARTSNSGSSKTSNNASSKGSK